jgi:hypothetical protein
MECVTKRRPRSHPHGAWFPSQRPSKLHTVGKELPTSRAKRDAQKHAKAKQHRRRKAQERLERDRRQAQHATKVWEQALNNLGLPENLVAEIEGRLRSQ